MIRTLRHSPRKGSTGKGISFSALAGIASLASSVLLLPLVISTVGAGPYGTWLFLLAIASFLFYLDLGVGTAVVHFLSRARSGDDSSSPNQIASTAHAWSVLAALAAALIFGCISWVYVSTQQGDPQLGSQDYFVLIACGFALLFSMAIRPMSAVLSGAGYLHIERGNQIVGVVARIIGTILACALSKSVSGVAIAETVALIAPTVASTMGVKSRGLIEVRLAHVSRIELKKMFSYSIGAFSVSMIGAAILQCGTLVIGSLGTANQVTYFNAAFRIYGSVRQIIGWLTDPFRPVLSKLFVKEGKAAQAVLYDLLFVAFIASSIGCIFLIIALPGLLSYWLGNTIPLAEVQVTAGILLSGLVLNAIHIPLIPASDAAGSPGAFLPHQLAWLVVYAVLSCILFPVFGIVGVALAMTLPLPVLELGYLFRAQKTVDLNSRTWFRRVISPAVPVLALGLLAAAGSHFLFPGVVGSLIACAAFVISSALTLIATRNHWSHRSILNSLRLES